MRTYAVVALSLLAIASVLALLQAQPVVAGFPGSNGWIALNEPGAAPGEVNFDVIRPDGSGRRRVAVNTSGARWAADGRRMVAMTRVAARTDVITMRDDGTDRRTIAQNAIVPAISPDGNRVVYYSFADFRIHVVNADGSGDRALGFGQAPSWSPDGTKIAYEASTGNTVETINWDIWVMNADGTAATRITTHPGRDLGPNWSPDGSKIAFYSYRDSGTTPPLNTEIYSMNADGSAQSRLTNSAGEDYSPRWSPDGSKIAFTTDRDGNFEVYVMNADGSAPQNLTRSPAIQGVSDWQPTVDLSVGASPRTRVIRVGRSAIFTMTLRNASPITASAVRLTVRVTGRGKVASVRSTGGSCRRGATVTCSIAELAAGASARVTITIRGTRTGAAVARATLTAAQPDPTAGNNVATVRATVKK